MNIFKSVQKLSILFSVFRKEVNKAKEDKQYERELREEFDEIIEEKKEIYNTELIEYSKKYRAWKFQRTKKASLGKNSNKI